MATGETVRFPSGDTTCAARHYPGTTDACVIMAGGFGVTKEPATDRFASAFNDAGYGVLAFDYRRLGESGGTPRQVVRIPDMVDDWDAAIAFAATLEGVDPTRIALWGFSVSGGVVLEVAARHPELAAVIAQTPNVDGRAASRNAMRHQRPGALLRFVGRAVTGGLVPLAGPPGTVAVLTTPDALDGDRAFDAANRYPDWDQRVSARSALRVGSYRPNRFAPSIRCPVLFVVAEDDQSALAAPALSAAAQTPHGETVTVAGGHYAPFLETHQQVVDAELAFLTRHATRRTEPEPRPGL